jgi:hypothetical protein
VRSRTSAGEYLGAMAHAPRSMSSSSREESTGGEMARAATVSPRREEGGPERGVLWSRGGVARAGDASGRCADASGSRG